MMPSSAMLMTPDRSEKRPPIAARSRGVARRIVDGISSKLKISCIGLTLCLLEESLAAAEQRLGCDEENHESLQDHDQVLRRVLGEDVHEQAPPDQRAEKERREQHAERMIAA